MADFDFSILKLPIEPDEWRDADDRMFHACFTVLGQFVEVELGTEAWDGNEEGLYRGYRRHSRDDFEAKAIDLWLWYRDELPKLEKEYDDDLREWLEEMRHPKFSYGYPDEVKNDKLAELIRIRRSLWT